MKKNKSDTPGYLLTEIAIAVILILAALLIAGTLDYQDAKETEIYWKEQIK